IRRRRRPSLLHAGQGAGAVARRLRPDRGSRGLPPRHRRRGPGCPVHAARGARDVRDRQARPELGRLPGLEGRRGLLVGDWNSPDVQGSPADRRRPRVHARVARRPDANGDLKARGPGQKLAAHLSPGGLLRGGGHWTRCIVFSPDGKKMYVSIGSRSNVSDNAAEQNRARIFEFNADGTGQNGYASGIRNAVGIAFRPGTNELWMSTNERDEIGEDLPPDYISSVRPGGFYGWPWYYVGNHHDPRHKGKHPELADKVIVPDVLVQAHSASLNLCFYTGDQFPAEYKGDIFAAFHGSWNRLKRTGYKVVRVPFDKSTGKTRGEYQDFVTGFVTPEGKVWGRPVGITVAKDGALLVSEDGNKTIWRVSHGR